MYIRQIKIYIIEEVNIKMSHSLPFQFFSTSYEPLLMVHNQDLKNNGNHPSIELGNDNYNYAFFAIQKRNEYILISKHVT